MLNMLKAERNWLASQMPGRPCDGPAHACPYNEPQGPDCRERIPACDCWLEEAWQKAGCMADAKEAQG